jgi:hypothetical protein|tara:strand:- start:172 stop:540 length:369 start_codon:yes stop_codon:yes gene_type:complete
MGKITQLTCPNCKHTEDIENMNFRKNSKIYMIKLYLQQRENPELQIYTFICFSCNHLTNYAGKIFGGPEYFETYKYDANVKFDNYHEAYGEKNQFQSMKRLVTDINYNNLLDHVVENFKKIK